MAESIYPWPRVNHYFCPAACHPRFAKRWRSQHVPSPAAARTHEVNGYVLLIIPAKKPTVIVKHRGQLHTVSKAFIT